ncbi:MAG: hypothetical protein AAGU11_04620 [Syntrophobacteraceae bacterium]
MFSYRPIFRRIFISSAPPSGAGANVPANGNAEQRDLPPELLEALSEYYRVPTMEHYDSMLRARGYFTYK